MVVSLFVTAENGILIQDNFAMANQHNSLLGLDVPYFYFSKKVSITKKSVSQKKFHCRIIMAYGIMDLGQHGFNLWFSLAAWQHQAIAWTSAHIYKKMHFKMSSAKWQPFYACFNVLNSLPNISWHAMNETCDYGNPF